MKDNLCSYYTNSDEITSYMANRLEISSNDIILEPSAGEGIFIDEILKADYPVQIDALDIDKKAISILKKKYKGYDSITVRETDTLLDERLDAFGIPELWLKRTDTLIDEQLDCFGVIGGHYDKVIGNPPYGAWQDYDKRDLLKKKYPGQYVKETYSLFLLRCISVLKMGGRLSFIIPDTYLFLNLHARLREVLLTSTKIEEIITFPSKFFPGVSFGYSNLSIITLERCSKEIALNNTVRIVQGFRSADEFRLLENKEKLSIYLSEFMLKQSDVLSNEQHRFILADNNITDTINKTSLKLGDVADVVTGFYTGDNKRFIRALNDNVKGSKNYDKVDSSIVFPCTSLDGIENVPEGYIPYVKSASSTRYYRLFDEWFVRWDKDTINYYNSNKKSRFQNSSFYFKTGVAIPMVKSSSIRAFLLENRVFDQSIVGIFPKDNSRLYYILAIMNSDIVNNLIHTINPTANNSANYVKQIPYIEPGQDVIDLISEKVKSIIYNFKHGNSNENKTLHSEINELIQQIYS
ncbi:MAG: N-6 DNA methylase [Clostridia bacterium]|nr:N-6 DNA methylase [Clostridia bacterium]